MTPDGNNILFGAGNQVQLWNAKTHSATNVATFSNPVVETAISSDGRHGACTINSSPLTRQRSVYAIDLVTQSNRFVGTSPYTSQKKPYSSAGMAIFSRMFSSTTQGRSQMYLYNFDNGTNTLASHDLSNVAGGNDRSDSPTLNWDGSLLAYRSAATNLVANDNNGDPDIFLYSRSTGQTTLVSASLYGEFFGE